MKPIACLLKPKTKRRLQGSGQLDRALFANGRSHLSKREGHQPHLVCTELFVCQRLHGNVACCLNSLFVCPKFDSAAVLLIWMQPGPFRRPFVRPAVSRCPVHLVVQRPNPPRLAAGTLHMRLALVAVGRCFPLKGHLAASEPPSAGIGRPMFLPWRWRFCLFRADWPCRSGSQCLHRRTARRYEPIPADIFFDFEAIAEVQRRNGAKARHQQGNQVKFSSPLQWMKGEGEREKRNPAITQATFDSVVGST